KPKFGTIPGITSWNEWKWPDNENETSFICACGLPGFGQWNIFFSITIEKIVKNYQIIKPQLTASIHSTLTKLWITPIPESTNPITQKENNLDSPY
ncbi:6221_t:CDS:1, partial [Cetraspora pellucida]